MTELTGFDPESVSGLQWDGESWLVMVDVLRARADPDHHRRDGHVRRAARSGRRAARIQAIPPLHPRPRRGGLSAWKAHSPRIAPPAGSPVAPSADANLADILERVLDKGIVIAGDIQINLLDIELLTIKLRLLIASVDRRARWGSTGGRPTRRCRAVDDDGDRADQLESENRELRERIERLERRIGAPQESESGDG